MLSWRCVRLLCCIGLMLGIGGAGMGALIGRAMGLGQESRCSIVFRTLSFLQSGTDPRATVRVRASAQGDAHVVFRNDATKPIRVYVGTVGGGLLTTDRDCLLIQPGSEAELVIERSAWKAAARATTGRLAAAGQSRIQLATDDVATPVIEVIVELHDE